MTAVPHQRSMRERLHTQGAWLFGGFAFGQACAFLRNAILGHALSKGDFGVAATITIVLQLVETLTDLGSDRLIVQAADGARRRFLAASHFVLVARGFLICATMLAFAPLLAEYFGAPHATIAFQLTAFAPLIKGFAHLDFRWAQRRFDNRPFVALEALPQAAALALTPAALSLAPDYSAVAWLAVAQALAAVAISHAIARRPYKVLFDADILKRHVAFGWPILASALPLIAVYQGDRMIVGRMQGMEALAGFTAAFMLTMAPGIVVAKVANALLLPAFSAIRRERRRMVEPFIQMTEVVVLAASLYLALFAIVGDRLLPIVFGPQYSGLGPVAFWLAVMWSLRMIQCIPGMALMADGATRPMLVAGVIRAHALPVVLAAAAYGASLASLAAIGAGFEVLSLAYVSHRVAALDRQLGPALALRSLFLVPAGLIAIAMAHVASGDLRFEVAGAITAATAIVLLALALMATLRAHLRRLNAPPASGFAFSKQV